jgi:hypothetical protein
MTQHPQPAAGSTLRRTGEELDTFWREHADWVQTLPGDGPHYAIPSAALGGPELERVLGARLEIERDLTRLCDGNGIVGVWGRRTITYHLITRPSFQLPADLVAQLGWGPSELAMIGTGTARADVAHARLHGVVGWLLTEPTFLTGVEQLRVEYGALTAAERPAFPLGRVVALNTPGAGTALPAGTLAFTEHLRLFLDRWG